MLRFVERAMERAKALEKGLITHASPQQTESNDLLVWFHGNLVSSQAQRKPSNVSSTPNKSESLSFINSKLIYANVVLSEKEIIELFLWKLIKPNTLPQLSLSHVTRRCQKSISMISKSGISQCFCDVKEFYLPLAPSSEKVPSLRGWCVRSASLYLYNWGKFPSGASMLHESILSATAARFGPGDAVAIPILSERRRCSHWNRRIFLKPSAIILESRRKFSRREHFCGGESGSIRSRLKAAGALSLTWALNRQGWKLVNSCDVFCLIRRNCSETRITIWRL